jgi:hypothetical protein
VVVHRFAELIAPSRLGRSFRWLLASSWVTNLMAGSRLVLAGRAEPPLRVARLRAEGRITEIGPADLSLARDEAASLLRGAGLELGADEVAELHRRTEGWPAGLYLAALYLREGGSLGTAAVSFGGRPVPGARPARRIRPGRPVGPRVPAGARPRRARPVRLASLTGPASPGWRPGLAPLAAGKRHRWNIDVARAATMVHRCCLAGGLWTGKGLTRGKCPRSCGSAGVRAFRGFLR